MVSRTSRLQNLDLLNQKQIHKSYQFSPDSLPSGLKTGLPPLVSRSVNETSFISDILKSSPISSRHNRYEARPQSLEVSKGYIGPKINEMHSKNGYILKPNAFTRNFNLKSGGATDRYSTDRIFHHYSPRKSLDLPNPLLTPSPSQVYKGLPPIPPAERSMLKRTDSKIELISTSLTPMKRDSSGVLKVTTIGSSSPSPPHFDPKLIQASIIKQKFNEEFKKKFSPFLNYRKSSNKQITSHAFPKGHRQSKSMIETTETLEEENLRKIRNQRRELQEAEEIKRQAKLAEVKMRNSLLKNKDFRKILKNYLKSSKITSTSEGQEYVEDKNGNKKVIEADKSGGNNGSFEAKGSFYVHSVGDQKGRSKYQDPDFKFLPPYGGVLKQDSPGVMGDRMLSGKAKRGGSVIDSSVYDTELKKGDLEKSHFSGSSTPREGTLGTQQLKGILKTGKRHSVKGGGDLKLPRVTFKIEGRKERARETPIVEKVQEQH